MCLACIRRRPTPCRIPAIFDASTPTSPSQTRFFRCLPLLRREQAASMSSNELAPSFAPFFGMVSGTARRIMDDFIANDMPRAESRLL